MLRERPGGKRCIQPQTDRLLAHDLIMQASYCGTGLCADLVQSRRVPLTSARWLPPSLLTGREEKGDTRAEIKAVRTVQPETETAQLLLDVTGGG